MKNSDSQRCMIPNDPSKHIGYLSSKDCLTEPEIIKKYCETHPQAICIGGYAHMGCRPEKSKREEFITYDLTKGCYLKSDGTVILTHQTYCGRKIPSRIWQGKEYQENQIWNQAGLGMPDLRDGDIIIEAKGGISTLSKVHTALGQLLLYKAHDPHLKLGFPEIWLQAQSIQRALNVLTENGVTLIPI
jgi:hypothetical protein